MVAARWVWGLVSSAVMLAGNGTATAQELQQTPILLAQSTQKSGDELYAEGDKFYFLGTREGYVSQALAQLTSCKRSESR
ncbi:hypothetical protein Lepto7376_0016 [[Leptolyngbya] sp. PCC 7376]|uniref:hypothetical protein n=1 Tax=[Leptolyngbya] sp. PCC 7376 TaxID=111781 RepID=UPI00029ECE1A|nr:hypothetical protein [[Leptolyngbya] sp. PCC 7376]AFY36478.1 hypothetical protein Lepto7376_0016 [[Leptolyngbya] sp. PCC 7376]